MRRPLLLLALTLLTLTSAPARAGDVDRSFRESFSCDDDTVLHLDHGDGDVTVTAWDKDEVEVEVIYRGAVRKVGIGTARTDFSVDFSRDGNAIRVKGNEVGEGMMLGFVSHQDHEYRYTVHAPSYVTLDMDGDDGAVTVNSWRQDIRCRVKDGRIQLRDIVADHVILNIGDGEVDVDGLNGRLTLDGEHTDAQLHDIRSPRSEIRIEAGSVRVQQSEGGFHIETGQGGVEVFRTRTSDLRIESGRGDIHVDLLHSLDPEVDIRTDGGKVRLALGRGTSAAFDVGSEQGNIRLDLPGTTLSRETRTHVSGSINGGRGSVHIRTRGGSIILKETTVVL